MMTDKLKSEPPSELIIGLVSAVGTENARVITLLAERLGLAGYSVQVIKVSSDVIPSLGEVPEHGNDNYRRISDLMDAGNSARSTASLSGDEGDSILARGIAARIYAQRKKDDKGRSDPLPKMAFIVDSLKRPEEVQELRQIYPFGFILIGIHADESNRRQHLIVDMGISETNADILMRRDREESKVDHGQRVSKTFYLADFFVRIADNHERLRSDIKRIVELWFGNPFITPTFDEYAMFLAFAASLRSADLSRQVGAVMTRGSEILSTGANDCPMAGGGLYWPIRREKAGGIGDIPNGRDYMRPDGDSNRAAQVRLIEQIVNDGQTSDYNFDPQKLLKLLNKSGIRDLTEYGRVVHAEMEALLSCSRNGLSTVGTTLYCTTFPCHNCAKHLIAAGVKRVVYVEPYPKSRTLEFHDDSITTSKDEGSQENELVKFHAFVGIGPRRYFDLFSMELGSSYPLIRKEKDSGRAKSWEIQNARLRIQMKPNSYLDLEAEACRIFEKALQSVANEE